jgi:hypothetical protein
VSDSVASPVFTLIAANLPVFGLKIRLVFVFVDGFASLGDISGGGRRIIEVFRHGFASVPDGSSILPFQRFG